MLVCKKTQLIAMPHRTKIVQPGVFLYGRLQILLQVAARIPVNSFFFLCTFFLFCYLLLAQSVVFQIVKLVSVIKEIERFQSITTTQQHFFEETE